MTLVFDVFTDLCHFSHTNYFGKTTLSKALLDHCKSTLRRPSYLYNLDPAAEDFLFESAHVDQGKYMLVSFLSYPLFQIFGS